MQTKVVQNYMTATGQSEELPVDLLQSSMDITFKALKETDVARHVNRLRKPSSKDDVWRLVDYLIFVCLVHLFFI
ncbi:hypothetical protein Ddye_015843 [Dipteronia dyeriana]|uniref:TFIIS N-terminal domain-containing protein n=1 Tax=Dipteronia dyeriana TaxID=168575 RepID=A0AAD9U680_9ROSI|nr:hypothetical protein Ddye_015843 [Dipteronia dyeriana]